MKIEFCAFSGYRVLPGRGIRFVRTDGKTFLLANSKCLSRLQYKKNPRKIAWTQFFRKVHKKNVEAQLKKKKKARTEKLERGVVGVSIEVIKARKEERRIKKLEMERKASEEIKAQKKKEEVPAEKPVDDKKEKRKAKRAEKKTKGSEKVGKEKSVSTKGVGRRY